jgi:hypothetical protein
MRVREREGFVPLQATELAPIDPATFKKGGVPPCAALSRHAAVFEAQTFADEMVREQGLADVHRKLLVRAATRYGVKLEDLQLLMKRSYQVTAKTPVGFTEEPGDVRWPPNQSKGRYLGFNMARSLIARLSSAPGIIKVKGAGQAYDHRQVTQSLNGTKRPPVPFAFYWDHSYPRSTTPLFSMQLEYAQDEMLYQILVHAISLRVFGRLANVPTPIDAAKIDHVEINGQRMSLARARSDLSLWRGHEAYLAGDVQDALRRFGHDEVEGYTEIASFEDLMRSLASVDRAEKRQALLEEGFAPIADEAEIDRAYARLRLAQDLDEVYPLGQMISIEAGQYRNNALEILTDTAVFQDAKHVLDKLLEQVLSQLGYAYTPPVDRGGSIDAYHQRAFEPWRNVAEKSVEQIARTMGRLYGLVRAIGGDTHNSFHPKDVIGAEVTDWSDYVLPLPHGETEIDFAPLEGWTGYQGGLDLNMQVIARLFRVQGGDLPAIWRDEAKKSVRAVVQAGLDGKLDDLLGVQLDNWRSFIAREHALAKAGGGELRDVLADMKLSICATGHDIQPLEPVDSSCPPV